MSTQEEAIKSKGFEFCKSFMDKCCNSGATGEKTGKFDFKSCEEMMKNSAAQKMENLILRPAGRKWNSCVNQRKKI